MIDIKLLEQEYRIVKNKYSELIDERLEMLRRGEFEGKEVEGKFFPEEIRLYKQSEKIRRKLLVLKPEMYHYGDMSKDKVKNKRNGVKPTSKGDNGFFICKECKNLFRHRGYSKEPRKIESRDCFEKCSEHSRRKSIGLLKLKKGDE